MELADGPRVFSSEYEILGKRIGSGGYGDVYTCRRIGDKSGQLYAVKQMHPRKEAGMLSVTSIASLREVKLLRELSAHPNIIKLVDVFLSWEPTSMHLVFELANFDLDKLIRAGTELSEDEIRSFMFQLLAGTDYLHSNWVIHRDLKPQNILVRGDVGTRSLIIADFGLARIFQQPVKALSDVERVVVTLWYRAPELLLGSRSYTKAVDVWALGCIFGELLCRQQLFAGVEDTAKGAPFQESQCRTIFNVLGLPDRHTWADLDKLPEYAHIKLWRSGFPRKSLLRDHATQLMKGRKLPKDAFDLMESMLQMDPSKRISAGDALKHPYFRGLKASKPALAIPDFAAERRRRAEELEGGAGGAPVAAGGAPVVAGAGASAGVDVHKDKRRRTAE